MKFEFCGKNECPEWVLAESSILSKLSAVKLKLICAQIIKKIWESYSAAYAGSIPFKVSKDKGYDEDKIYRLWNDCKLNQDETYTVIAVLDFIILNATKCSVDQDIFSKEISHLGIPIENVNVIVKAYTEKAKELEIVRYGSLQVSQVGQVNAKLWEIVASSMVGHTEFDETEERTPIGFQINMSVDVFEGTNKGISSLPFLFLHTFCDFKVMTALNWVWLRWQKATKNNPQVCNGIW